MREAQGTESVLIFSSAHHMLRAEQTLLDAGLDIELVAAPRAAGELCTTAVCFPSALEREVRALLAERHVEVKDIMSYQRPQAARRAPTRQEIIDMLEARGVAGLPIRVEAGKATERAFGIRVSLMAVVGPDGAGIGEALALGIPLLLVDLTGDPPDRARLRAGLAVGPCIATALAPRLEAAGIEELRSCGIQYFLTPGRDPGELSAEELAEELMFQRDNRSGVIGTGSLIPLLDPAEARGAGRERLLGLLATARLVMPDAHIPAPAWLWTNGVPGSCNLMVVDAARGELRMSVEKLRDRLKKTGRRMLASVEERCWRAG